MENEAENSCSHDLGSVEKNIHRTLRKCKERLEEKLQDLWSHTEKVEHANYMSRMKRMRGVMEEFEALLSEARVCYERSIRPALKRTEDVDSVLERNGAVEAARDGTVIFFRRDQYKSGSNILPNPSRLTLDYSSTATFEGIRKAEILGSVRSSSRIVRVMVLCLGGVGKTDALRGLADEEGFKKRFPDVALFMQFGNDSVLSDIINGIAACVEETGEKRLSRVIKVLVTLE